MQFNLPEKIFQNWINCCIFCRIVKKQIFFLRTACMFKLINVKIYHFWETL